MANRTIVGSKMESKVKEIDKILEQNSNRICADCNSDKIIGLSTDWSVFVCKECTEAHVKLGGGWRSIISLRSTNAADLKSLITDKKGNQQINAELEAEFPPSYRRPWPGPGCPEFLRTSFVHYKYISNAFSHGATAKGLQVGFSNISKSGMLLKKLRDSNTFASRRFELNGTTNTVMYFIKPTDTDPKTVIDLERCNMTFANSADFNVPSHTMIFQFVQDFSTRHIFVRSEHSQDILNWYNTLRLCKYKRLRQHLSGAGENVPLTEILSHLTFDLEKVGWLQKSGPDFTFSFRKRWLMLAKRRLLYTNDPLSAFAKGEIFIGSKEDGYSIEREAPLGWKKCPAFPFTLVTPDRPFVFCAASELEKEDWINKLRAIVDRPVTLLDVKMAAPIYNKM